PEAPATAATAPGGCRVVSPREARRGAATRPPPQEPSAASGGGKGGGKGGRDARGPTRNGTSAASSLRPAATPRPLRRDRSRHRGAAEARPLSGRGDARLARDDPGRGASGAGGVYRRIARQGAALPAGSPRPWPDERRDPQDGRAALARRGGVAPPRAGDRPGSTWRRRQRRALRAA